MFGALDDQVIWSYDKREYADISLSAEFLCQLYILVHADSREYKDVVSDDIRVMIR